MGRLSSICSHWSRRVFTLDLRSLALCRILTGLVVLGDLISRAQSFRIHYTDEGIVPRQALFELGLLRFPSIYAVSGWEVFLAGLLLAHGLVAVLFSLGYRTRLTNALLWYLTVSLQARLYLANNGGDTVLASILFWGLFLPWGEALSVDAHSRRESEGDSTRPSEVYSTATVIVMLQVLSLYWVSVFHKMEPIWLRGEVLYYAFQCDLYAFPIGQWLLPYLGLLKTLAYGTLAWELVGPLCLLCAWPTVRAAACGIFSIMHLNFGIFLRIGTFAFSPLLYMAALLPAAVWDLPPFRYLSQRFDGWCRRLAAKLTPKEERRLRWNPPLSCALYLLFVYVFLTSLSQDPRVGRLLPTRLDWVAHTTGLYQRWGVFVDMPRILDGWFIMEGQLSDGRVVDLFQGNSPVRWEKPPTPYTRYQSFRWPTPMVVITGSPNLYPWFLRALALDWERENPGDKVVWGRFNLMKEQTLPDYGQAPVQRFIYWEGQLNK